MDERQRNIQEKAMGGTIFFVYLYLLIEIVYKLIKTKEIFNCSWEIGLLFCMSFVFVFLSRKDESLMLPKTIRGKELSIEESRGQKAGRIRQYLINALGFSLGMCILSILFFVFGGIQDNDLQLIHGLSKTGNYILAVGLDFLLLFVISFLFDTIYYEHKIKKYNQLLDRMEEEDDDK